MIFLIVSICPFFSVDAFVKAQYSGEYYDLETNTYYLRARNYDPTTGRFLSEDTHWNTSNMIYGDYPVRNSNYQDPLGLSTYTYVPDIYAIRQSSNLYAYCGNNPLMFIDPTGNAWYHWAIGGLIVVVAAAAVVVTAGGALPAVYAIGAVASGATAATVGTTVAAGAFIGSSMALGTAGFMAAIDSSSISEFNQKGNWGVVLYTAGGAGLGGLSGYLAARGTEKNNIFTNKKYTNSTSTGVSNYQSNKTGMNAAEADFKSLKLTGVKTYSNGTKVGYLPDGRTVDLHIGTSTGGPTLGIYDPSTGEKIKIRY